MSEFLDSMSELVMEFSRLVLLRHFNLPSLGLRSEVAQEFMVTMMTIGLSQIIQNPRKDSGSMPDLMFLLNQLLYDLKLWDQSVSNLSCHAMIIMRFSVHCRGAGPIRFVHFSMTDSSRWVSEGIEGCFD